MKSAHNAKIDASQLPSSSRSSAPNEILIAGIIFIASLIYYLSYAFYGYSESDWGGIVVAAERFLKGEVFYKDFSIVYTPGIYIYTALAFKILGTELRSALIAWSLIRAVNCVLFYFAGRIFFKNKIVTILPLILWIIPGPIHKSFIVFFCLLHLIVLITLLLSNHRGLYILAGIVAGVSFIFRLDLLMSFTITLLIIECIKFFNTKKIAKWQSLKGSTLNLLIYTLGVLLAIFPFVVYLMVNSAFIDAVNQTLYFLGTARSRLFLLPPLSRILSWSIWDFSNYVVIFIPLTIAVLLLSEIVHNIWSRRFDIINKQLLILFIHGILSLHQVLRWPWAGRLYQILPPFIIADIYLFSKWYLKRPLQSSSSFYSFIKTLMVITNLLLLSLVFGSLTMDDMYTNNSILIRLKNRTLLSYPKLRVYTTEKQANEVKKLVDVIERETRKDNYIYIVQYYPMYYFITGRRNATRYYFLEAYVYSDDKQKEVIRDLEEKNVRLIISGPNHPGTPEATLLNDYLNKNFVIIGHQGKKVIYRRKVAQDG
jgi:hypothetical protein